MAFLVNDRVKETSTTTGTGTLSLAGAGINKKWNIKRQHYSKIDTSDFYCLPTIKAI